MWLLCVSGGRKSFIKLKNERSECEKAQFGPVQRLRWSEEEEPAHWLLFERVLEAVDGGLLASLRILADLGGHVRLSHLQSRSDPAQVAGKFGEH